MEEKKQDDIRGVIRSVIEEFITTERRQTEPAYKAELIEEKRRRESLEKRVNELVEENRKSRQAAEEIDRHSQIRAELQRLGVSKVDLAFKIVRDDVQRAADGRLTAKTADGERPLGEYLSAFVEQNPEFLPARISGGSGVTSPQRGGQMQSALELERIKPGMNPEELQRVREQVSQLALQSLRGE